MKGHSTESDSIFVADKRKEISVLKTIDLLEERNH